RRGPGLAAHRDAPVIRRQAVEGRAVPRRESLEMVESAFFLEYLDVEFEGRGGGEDAGAAAASLLGRDRMRCAVGAKEKRGVARGRGAAQRAAVLLALGDRQAIEMRPDAADKQRVAI